jgi:hypothetical protein
MRGESEGCPLSISLFNGGGVEQRGGNEERRRDTHVCIPNDRRPNLRAAKLGSIWQFRGAKWQLLPALIASERTGNTKC